MYQLKYLEVQGFRSFREKTRVEFPPTGLVLVRGRSGVGKTNLFLAISYALDICPVPATKLKSWYSERGFQVEVGIETREGLVVIKRGRENSVTREGQIPITGAKAVAEEIPKILGMNTDILSAVTYRVQRKPGAFVSKGDAEKREFLGALIPLLSSIENAVEVSEQELKKLNALIEPLLSKKTNLLETTKKLIESQNEDDLSGWEKERNALVEDVKRFDSERTAIKLATQDVNNKLKEALGAVEVTPSLVALKESVRILREKLVEETEIERTRKAQFEQSQKQLHTQISALEKGLWNARSEASQELSLRKQLEVMEANTCPTCSQSWVTNEAQKAKILEMLANIERVKLNIPAIEGVIVNMKKTMKGWEERPELRALSTTIAVKEGEVSSELARLRADVNSQFKDTKQKLELENMRLASEAGKAESLLESGDRRFKEVQAVRDRIKKMISENEAAAIKTDAEIAELRAKALLEENIVRLLGKNGFLGSIFDQILIEIETEINKMLVNMTNTRSMSIKFKTETFTAKGTSKKTITPVVYIDGNESDLATGPSGGQQSSIELVIDLAVLRVVERRTGRTPGWLLQDEVIIGQGADTSVNAIEILKEFAEDKMVLVIDHSSEVKEHFQKVIDVRMENGVSYIS